MSTKALAVRLVRGQTVPFEQKLDLLMDLREQLEEGYVTVSEIAKMYNISVPSAAIWRKEALQLIGKDSNGFTREGIRNLQIGRIMAKIEKLELMLKQQTDTELLLKIHDRISNYYERLHRITGLNTEVNIQASPDKLVIIKNRDDKEPTIIDQ